MSEHELIITVINRGCSDEVMAAARRAGATGGTVINARGTGTPELKRFFGTVIQPEKELVLILAAKEKRTPIMEAVTESAGLSAEGKGLCFSLPVSGVRGLRVSEETEAPSEHLE